MKDFKNKVAVITGSGSGMGRELAKELANAGANIALVEINEETLNETAELGILLHGVINGTRAFLPFLKDRPEAAIINTSSIFGLLSVPNQSIYHVGKYGVRGFTESLALEMKMEKSNVEVYSVHPGHIGTNIANIGAKNGKFDFDEDAEDGPNLFGAQAKTVEEAGQLFKDKAPINANTAAKIILKNIISY